MFKFRDYGLNNQLETYYETDEPAFLVGLKSETRLRYGHFDELVPLMQKYSVLEPVAVVSLPKNQEDIDTLFQNTGATQRFIKTWKKMQNITEV